MKQLQSKYFTLEEFTKSQTATRLGLDNAPNDEVIESLNWLCMKVLDPLRAKIKRAIIISSGYRSINLNKAVGGVSDKEKISQHTLGQAADIYCPGMTPKELFDYIIKETKLPFDQLILEFDQWVHISYNRNVQRGTKMIAKKILNKTEYQYV